MRISDWSSDVCSSDLEPSRLKVAKVRLPLHPRQARQPPPPRLPCCARRPVCACIACRTTASPPTWKRTAPRARSEESHVGEEQIITVRVRESPYHEKQKSITQSQLYHHK